MKVRFSLNPDGQPHVHDHAVEEREVLEALSQGLERIAGRNDTTVLIGRTAAGRVLRIVYADIRDGEGVFVITAYELPLRQLRALKRRLRRRRR